MDAMQQRALFNPYDEVPLRITAEAVRATRNAYLTAAVVAEQEMRRTSHAGAKATFAETARMYRALADERARAIGRHHALAGLEAVA